jgi:putative transposase
MPDLRGRFSETQIRGFLREAAAGTPIVELCWNHCFSRSTFRAWKGKYGATSDESAIARGNSEREARRRDVRANRARVGEHEQV